MKPVTAADMAVAAAATELSGAVRACLVQALIGAGQAEWAHRLQAATLRVVRAPDIGCMPNLPEHCLQIDADAATYAAGAALDAAQKAQWLSLWQPCLQAGDAEWNVVDIDFGRRA